jgi:hypothetical protein
MKATVSKTIYSLTTTIEPDHLLCKMDRAPYALMYVCVGVLKEGPKAL